MYGSKVIGVVKVIVDSNPTDPELSYTLVQWTIWENKNYRTTCWPYQQMIHLICSLHVKTAEDLVFVCITWNLHSFTNTYQNSNPCFSPARWLEKLDIWHLNIAIKILQTFDVSNNSDFEICNTILHQLGHVYRHVRQYQKSNMLHKTTIEIFKTMNYPIQTFSSWLLWAVFLQLSSTVPWCYGCLPSSEAWSMAGTGYWMLIPLQQLISQMVLGSYSSQSCQFNSTQLVWSSLRIFSQRSSSRSQHR